MIAIIVGLFISWVFTLLRWVVSVKKLQVLGLLMSCGELSGGTIAIRVGLLTYNALHELEAEGLVLLRQEEDVHWKRGDRPRFYYRLPESVARPVLG